MLTNYPTLLILLMPAVTYSGIVIKIKPTKNGDDTNVDFYGEDLAVINDKERELFQIDDESLKKAAEKFMGKRCTNVYLKPPTPWGDVYKQYGWDPVRRNIKPIEAKVISVDSKPVAIRSVVYVNNHISLDVTRNISVTQQVNETVTHTWSTGGEYDINQDINYEVNFGVGSVGANTTLSYTGSCGEHKMKSRTVTIGNTSTILGDLPPGNSVVASLIATHSTVDIEIRYSTDLTGKVFCNFEAPFYGHHFYSLPIYQLQEVADMPLVKYSTEKISVRFYSSVKLQVHNRTVL